MADAEEVDIPSKTYKIINGRIAGYADELPAMRQAVEKLLSTERCEWNIYSDNYGVELNHLIGENFDLVKSELERIIKAALLADDRISAAEDFEVSKQAADILTATFRVSTIYGDMTVSKEVRI